MCRVLIGIDATHAGIRTSVRSTPPYDNASLLNGTLPYPPRKLEAGVWKPGGTPRRVQLLVSSLKLPGSHGFGERLSPVTLSAQSHSTSELLRTLSRVAASKPTSWLSLQLNILSH